MSSRASAWLARSLAGLSGAVFVASVAFYVLARSAQVPSGSGASRTILDLLVSVPLLAFPLVGALIASRRPHNPIGWICLADGLLWMLLSVFDYYSVYGLAKPGSVPFPVTITGLSLWLWVPTVGLIAIYLVLLFPDGKLPSRRWRPLAWVSGVVIVLLSVTEVLAELQGVGPPGGRAPRGRGRPRSAAYQRLDLLVHRYRCLGGPVPVRDRTLDGVGRAGQGAAGVALFAAQPFVRAMMDPDHKIEHWSDFDRGGQFPAMEVPDLLVGDIREFFHGLR